METGSAPALPNYGWQHQARIPSKATSAITAALDSFVLRQAGATKHDMLLTYVKDAPCNINCSQLMQAELVYIFFKEDESPLFYDEDEDIWWVYERFWKPTQSSMTRVKSLFQSGFLKAMRQAVQKAATNNTFPPQPDGTDHYKLAFLKNTVIKLECRESVEKIIKESAMFMMRVPDFDSNPDILQLQNCVLDLKTLDFRRGRPSDMCKRASTITIPEEWLESPELIDTESIEYRDIAWNVMWSMFERKDMSKKADHHPDDHSQGSS